jgi:predicted nuclease of predicted toxin-antitoxin system
MKILFDQGTPVPLRRLLSDHVVETAYERGWSTLKNGALLANAEKHGFDALMTTDQNLRYQQDISARQLAVVVLTSANWSQIQLRVEDIRVALAALTAGGYVEVEI